MRGKDLIINQITEKVLKMPDFVNAVGDFFLQEKGVSISSVDYMEMPKEREKYNLTKAIGNVNLTAGRFKIESEVNSVINKFLSMRLP